MPELLNPTALALVPLVAVLLLLNRRRTSDRRSVANLYIWQAAPQQAPARIAFQRLWRNWLLVLQAAFMLVVIAAIARPASHWSAASAAFVFDLSASMSASERGGSRLELARQRALATLADLRRGRVRIIAAAATAADRGEFSIGRAAQDAIREQVATSGAAAIADAIRLARASGASDVYVFTDTAQPRAAIDPQLHWIQVGSAVDNVAITSLSARRSRSAGGHVLVGVHNYGVSAKDVSLEIRQDDRIIATRRLSAGASSTTTHLERVADISGTIAASIDTDDGLRIDNRRLTLVRPAEPLRVLLRARPNLFIEKALAANPGITVETAPPGAPSDFRDYDVIVCADCSDLPARRGGVVLFHTVDSASAEPAAPLTVTETGHPVAQSVDVSEVVAAVSGPDGDRDGEVLIRAGGRPAVLAYDRPARRVVDVRIDTGASSTFPLSVGFPVLVANAVEWVADRNRNAAELAAGEPLQWFVPGATQSADVRVVTPDGGRSPARIENGILTFDRTDQPGVYKVQGLGVERRFVVNAATAESDLSIHPLPSPGSIAPPGAGAEALARRDLAIWLIVIAIVLLAVEWWIFHRQIASRRRSFAWRAATSALLVLAAVRLRLPFGDSPIAAMFVLDRSDSIPVRAQAAAVARVRQMTADMQPTDRAGLIVFGADAAVERQPGERFQPAELSSRVASSGTDIESAIGLARALLAPGSTAAGTIVLFSDGRETIGRAANEAARAAAGGIRIDAVGIGSSASDQLRVTAVAAPTEAAIREPFAVRVDVEGRANATGRVTLVRDGTHATADVVVPATGTASVLFNDVQQAGGFYTYTATVDRGDDRDEDRDAAAPAGAVVHVSGAPSLLYVGTGSGGGLAGPFAAAGFDVERTGADEVPGEATALRRFSAVVLDQVRSDRLSVAQSAALASYVEATGGGLLVLGGAETLDAGSFATSALGGILPVDVRPRSGRRQQTMGLVLVFDKSGSMADRAAGIPKIEIAREAARKAFDIVPPGDSIGVIAFDAAPAAVIPLGPVGEARQTADRLRAIQPGGSTSIAPAVELALEWLRSASVGKRHILLVSDGRTSAEDADRLRAAMRTPGVELSVVAIGGDADRQFLQRLAESSGGRAFFPDDVRQLPAIVAREATRAAGGSTVTEPFAVRAAAHPALAGIDRTALPTLNGYVVSAAKPGATAILSSHFDDPVLAAWQAGLGRVAIFTSDLASPWTSGFRQWREFGPLWTQTVRWLGRRATDAAFTASVVETVGAARLVVEAERPDGRIVNLLDARATVRGPGGEETTIELEPRQPGRYEAAIPVTQSGTYMLAVSGRDGGDDVRVVRAFYWSADRERRSTGIDRAGLERLTAPTGGRMLDGNGNPFTGDRPRAYRDLRPILLTVALVAFLIDIALRRGVRGGRRAPSRSRARHAAA